LSDDPIVQEVNEAQSRLGAALVPGAYMVDAYPFLRYVPGYLSELRKQHHMELALFKSQLDSVREQLVRTTYLTFNIYSGVSRLRTRR
jgi:hypothetical protein